MSADILTIVLTEVAKMGLNIFFQNMRTLNVTEEEIQKLFNSEKKLFDRSNPDDLPDV